MCLLSTRNHAFAKIIAQVIRLRAHHPKHQIQSIRMDNAAEFSSNAFNDYCMALGIQVQHSVPYVHTQNGLQNLLLRELNSLQDRYYKIAIYQLHVGVMQSYTLLT